MSLRHSPDFSGALAQFGTDATPREQRDLENERKLREQRGTTFSQFAQAEADQVQGRFAAHEKSNVVGSAPIPAYPAGPNWSTDPGSQCIEPPLSYDNPALDENSAGIRPPVDTGPADAPEQSPDLSEHAAGPSSCNQDDNNG